MLWEILYLTDVGPVEKRFYYLQTRQFLKNICKKVLLLTVPVLLLFAPASSTQFCLLIVFVFMIE